MTCSSSLTTKRQKTSHPNQTLRLNLLPNQSSQFNYIDSELDELSSSISATPSTPRSESSASDFTTIGTASGSGIAVRKRKRGAPMHDEIRNANMQRAVDVLNNIKDDQWTCVGTLVASELRDLAKKSSSVADQAKRSVAISMSIR